MVLYQLTENPCHCIRCRGLRRVNPEAIGGEFAGREVNNGGLHAAASDIDTKSELSVVHVRRT
jgi:hypothetical protein